MGEKEEKLKQNFVFLSSKKQKSKSSKNCIIKKYKRIKHHKSQINNIQKIFDKGISCNKPVNLVFISDNSVKPFPLLSNGAKNVNNDEYLVLNDEMKINKNILENNLLNLLKNKKKIKTHKSHKNLNKNNLFNSFFQNKTSKINEDKNYIDSNGPEDQRSLESFNGKEKATNPSTNRNKKRKNTYLSASNKKKKLKLKSPCKSCKKKISLIKILNKPFCFMAAKTNKDFSKDKINYNINCYIKPQNNRYININIMNSYDKINSTNKDILKDEGISSYNNKRSRFLLNKNRSSNDVVNFGEDNNNIPHESLYQFKLNLLRSSASKQTNQFSVYHFYKTNNIFIFIKNSKYKKDNYIKKNNIYEIDDDFYLPAAYCPRMNRWSTIPECIENTCKRGGITLIKNIDNCNIIWKLMNYNKMKELIREINYNQKYNHFPSTFQLGRKDNLYKHIKYFKRLFPDLYNFVPSTYIIPSDGKNFEFNFKKNRKAIWIVKPVNMSRGRGVHILKGESEFRFLLKKSINLNISQFLISRYIDNPHLINKKKYDLRIYVLITSFSPLRIYLYNNGLVRFATEDYKKGDFDNIFIHLTNYSINKNNLKYKPNQNLDFSKNINEDENNDLNDDNEVDDDSSKWSLIEYRHFFQKMEKKQVMDSIWKQIEDIVIKTVLSVSEDYYQEISINKMNSLFELYGFDIMIDENFHAWLIEVNVNPSLHCTSPLDVSIKTDLITDIFNIVGIIPYNHNNNGETVFNYLMKKTKIDFDLNNKLFPKLRFTSDKYFNAFKDLENNVNINKSGYQNNGFSNINNNSLMTIKSIILRNFDKNNLKQKLPEYDNEFYKRIIDNFEEEKSRAELTDFNLIFPLKNNIEFYSQILIKSNYLNDSNIVIWEHALKEK